MSSQPTPKKLTWSDYYDLRPRLSFWITLTFVSPAGALFALIADRLKLSPNGVSLLSLLVSVFFTALAVFFLPLGLPLWIILFLTLYVGYALDCADGMLARGQERGTPFGGVFDKLIDAISGTTLPILLGIAAWNLPSSFSEKNKLIILFLSFAPRSWFSVVSWLKDNIQGQFKRSKDDKPSSSTSVKIRRFIGNSIDEITWRLAHWLGLVTGYYWETALVFGCLFLIFLPLYTLQTWHEHQFTKPGYAPMSLFKKLSCLALGLVATLLRIWNKIFISHSPGVFLIEPFGMGDIVTMRPLLTKLNHEWDQPIYLCLSKKWFDILSDLPKVTLVESKAPWAGYTRKTKYGIKNYFGHDFVSWVLSLRQHGKGLLGVDTRGDIRSMIILYLAGCRDVVSAKSYISTEIGAGAWCAQHIKLGNDLLRWQTHLPFYTAITGQVTPSFDPPSFPNYVKNWPPKISKIGFIPCAPWAGRLWPSENWITVINHLKKRPELSFVGFAGPQQTSEAQAFLGSDIPIVECASINSWLETLTQCDLILSTDTGPAHLSAALNIPILTLAGSTPIPLWILPGRWSRFIEKQSLIGGFPVLQHDGNLDICQKSMNLISPDDVIKALTDLINEYETEMAQASRVTPV